MLAQAKRKNRNMVTYCSSKPQRHWSVAYILFYSESFRNRISQGLGLYFNIQKPTFWPLFDLEFPCICKTIKFSLFWMPIMFQIKTYLRYVEVEQWQMFLGNYAIYPFYKFFASRGFCRIASMHFFRRYTKCTGHACINPWLYLCWCAFATKTMILHLTVWAVNFCQDWD